MKRFFINLLAATGGCFVFGVCIFLISDKANDFDRQPTNKQPAPVPKCQCAKQPRLL